jgi:cell division protein FtsL
MNAATSQETPFQDARTRFFWVWALFLMIFLGQLLFYTWCRVQCVRVGYEITQETEYYQRLRALQKALRIELARLKSPDRIARIAKYQLGLSPPRPEQVIAVP